MSFYIISTLINAAVSLASGIIVFFKKGRELVYVTFILFSFSVFWWSLWYYFWQQAITAINALLLIRFFMAGAIFISTTFLHFALTFIGEQRRYMRVILTSYVVFGLFFLANFTPLFVSGVTKRMSFMFWPVPGPLFHPFLVLWTIQVIYVLVVLYRAHRKSIGDAQMQLKYIFWGTTLGFLGGSTNYFLWYGIPILPIGNILVASYVIAVVIGVLRYNLFNIKIIIVELAVLLLNLFLFLNLFTSNLRADFILNIVIFVGILFFSLFLLRGIYKNIRNRTRIEELAGEMQVANERLRIMEGQKTEFVSIASHQLRTPLTVIKGYASMILEGTFGNINDAARDAMEKLFKSSDRIVALVEDLLTVSRIEQGRITLSFEAVNLTSFMREIFKDEAEAIKQSGLEVSFTSDIGKQYWSPIDVKKFKQVVKHILDNAIKYTVAPGMIHVNIIEDLTTRKNRIAISDTGVGITEEQIRMIFDRFDLKKNTPVERPLDGMRERDYSLPEGVSNEQDAPEKKTPGIGLYIAQEIIRAHHGALRIESAGTNKGTTFIIELPRVNG